MILEKIAQQSETIKIFKELIDKRHDEILKLKAHREIFKKRCCKKYFSYDKTCHFSAL